MPVQTQSTDATTSNEYFLPLESAPYGVVAVNSRGCIVYLNARLASMFGFCCEELLGQPIEILLAQRLRYIHLRLREVFALFPRTRPMGAKQELVGLSKDGGEFLLDIGLEPITVDGAELVLATVIEHKHVTDSGIAGGAPRHG